jgi:hypothetical protein
MANGTTPPNVPDSWWTFLDKAQALITRIGVIVGIIVTAIYSIRGHSESTDAAVDAKAAKQTSAVNAQKLDAVADASLTPDKAAAVKGIGK